MRVASELGTEKIWVQLIHHSSFTVKKPYGDNTTFYNLWRGRRQQKISTDKQAKRFHSAIVCKQLSKWLQTADERRRLQTQTTGKYRRHRVQRTCCTFEKRKILLKNYVKLCDWIRLNFRVAETTSIWPRSYSKHLTCDKSMEGRTKKVGPTLFLSERIKEKSLDRYS